MTKVKGLKWIRRNSNGNQKMARVFLDEKFGVLFLKIKDDLLKEKISRQIKKIGTNPNIGMITMCL
ncbi:hypothetical protein GWO43_18570 [candidate division KSB1 bacterium]|nr:hypothetical protein [candidate division KSB1 bacterium]NIR70639.1 hypothetical protein [candidate division KSB1 bacterium]NIS26017.1 hypothetical protein [candidate division KSB1 bacterium]NIT72841.1 hypothetical protein [candidate division KSB1 bacterium]NIU26682.1 hypothetical protein [candidate division KSB1 bacterium]